LFRENQNETGGLKREVADPLSIPSHEELLVRDQAEGNNGSGALPQLVLLAAKAECSVFIRSAFIV
jgi:hypothetical protein